MKTGNAPLSSSRETTLEKGGTVTRPLGKAPAVACPACGMRANVRSSDEISPTYRRLYMACSNFHCGMTFVCSLAFEHVLSPSAISAEFRPAKTKADKAPGHEYGQLPVVT